MRHAFTESPITAPKPSVVVEKKEEVYEFDVSIDENSFVDEDDMLLKSPLNHSVFDDVIKEKTRRFPLAQLRRGSSKNNSKIRKGKGHLSSITLRH